MNEGLEHSGQKGMKWYQHKYGRWQTHAQYAGGQEDPNKEKKDNAEKEAKRRQKILSSPIKLRKHYKEFSDEEIQKAIKNFETERRLKTITSDNIRLGKDIISNIADGIHAGIKGYNGAISIYNAFMKTDHPKIKTSIPVPDDKKKKKETG